MPFRAHAAAGNAVTGLSRFGCLPACFVWLPTLARTGGQADNQTTDKDTDTDAGKCRALIIDACVHLLRFFIFLLRCFFCALLQLRVSDLDALSTQSQASSVRAPTDGDSSGPSAVLPPLSPPLAA